MYVSLREEIMQQIVARIDDLCCENDVDCLYEIENKPSLCADVIECTNGHYSIETVGITDIKGDGTFIGYYVTDDHGEDEWFSLSQVSTDSLIDIYETLYME